MKEFLTAGTTIAALLMPAYQPVRPVCELDCPPPVMQTDSEGFVPRERITLPPVQSDAPDTLLPDFGSPAYL